MDGSDVRPVRRLGDPAEAVEDARKLARMLERAERVLLVLPKWWAVGDPDRPAMLLIMGLGTQMIAWPEPFCERLAAGGFRVIRFDNRDAGLSTQMDEFPRTTVGGVSLSRLLIGTNWFLGYSHTSAAKSKFIKDFITYDQYLRALLREYALASEGKVRVSFVDPVPDSDEAQDAQDFGLEGKPINQHGDLFFFGLVVESQTGSKDIIEFLWPDRQEDLEYEVSRRIYNLLWPSQKRIGVLSSLEVLPDDDPYMAQLMAAQGRRPRKTIVGATLAHGTAFGLR